jgi:5-methylthioadenosine/S-adenosylhomocysteine deaminase
VAITILLPHWLVPVRPRLQVLEKMAVVIEDELITAILPREQALATYPAASYVELSEHVLLPGFINTHSHSAMSLLRGYADEMNLQEWLNEHIWPAEKAFLGSNFVRDGSDLAIAEMLRGGTTCFNDLYFYPEVTANAALEAGMRACIGIAALEAGMRACIGIPVINIPTPWAANEDECLDKGLELSAGWQDEALISTALAPHAPYSVGDAALERVAELSAARDMRVHMHVLESAWEVTESETRHGKSTMTRLKDLGLLNERLIAVPLTQLDGVDLAALADAGVNVVHCPESNLKLGSGICPVARLLDHGINVALGTDGAACNNDLDLLSESRTAALMAKGFSADPGVLNAFQTLEMVTINAALALGQSDRIGSVEVGKQADLCAIRLDSLHTTPMYDVVSHLIYAVSSQQVSHVWVAGRMLLEDKEFLHLDVSDIIGRARHWADRITAGV